MQETLSHGPLGQTQPVSRAHQRRYGKRGKGIRRCVAGDCAWNDYNFFGHLGGLRYASAIPKHTLPGSAPIAKSC